MKKMITGIRTVCEKAPVVQCPRFTDTGSAPGAAAVLGTLVPLRELTLAEGPSLISHRAGPMPFD